MKTVMNVIALMTLPFALTGCDIDNTYSNGYSSGPSTSSSTTYTTRETGYYSDRTPQQHVHGRRPPATSGYYSSGSRPANQPPASTNYYSSQPSSPPPASDYYSSQPQPPSPPPPAPTPVPPTDNGYTSSGVIPVTPSSKSLTPVAPKKVENKSDDEENPEGYSSTPRDTIPTSQPVGATPAAPSDGGYSSSH